MDLVDHLTTRVRHAELQARVVELKLRSFRFRTRTKSKSLSVPTNVTDVIWQAAAELLRRSLTSDMLPVRLLGVGVSKLTTQDGSQRELFESGPSIGQSKLDQAVDAIRNRFGTGAIRRGIVIAQPDREGRPPALK
jgi:DNA polymerase-4